MKTTGLTLQEALQALVDGKCSKIRFAQSPRFVVLNRDEFCMDNGDRFVIVPAILTPEWSLIDPVQEYEDVEVVRWAVLTRDGYIIRYLKSQPEPDYCIKNTGIRIIKMTGIDRVPKKEKVMRRVEVEAGVSSDGDAYGIISGYPLKAHPETHGKTGKLIFEWEE